MKKRRTLASLVTVAGVVAIWAFASMRQSEQTEAISRQWVGEQWDVARQCIVGTPIGRGEDTEARLAARAIETLREASIGDEADFERLWPARCVGLLASLDVDRPVANGDTSDAVSELEVLMPRVLDVADAARTIASARELARGIAALDEMMPHGAEYEADAFPEPAVGLEMALAIAESMSCETQSVRRPFLRASAGGEVLFDELGGERLTRSEDGTVTMSSPNGSTEIEALGSFVRFADGQLAWLVDEGTAIVRGETRVELPIENAASAFAPCGNGWLLLVDERVVLVRGEHRVDLRPTPSLSGATWVCNDELALVADADGERWRGVRCSDTCEAMAPLEAGGDLQLGAVNSTALAVGRSVRGDLPLLWRLEPDGWSDPVPVLRGRFVREETHVLHACDQTVDLAVYTGAPGNSAATR